MSAPDRMLAFEQERAVYKQLIALYIREQGDYDKALDIADVSRAGGSGRSGLGASGAIVSVAKRLPAGVAIVHYELLEDRLVAWLLTRDGVDHFSHDASPEDLSSRVARLNRSIANGASFADIVDGSRPLAKLLIDPVLSRKPTIDTLFFVPDGPLHDLAFGALPDLSGRPLLESKTVGIALSATSFLAASDRLSSFSADGVLAIGDGHDPVCPA